MSRSPRKQSGFTIVELVISMCIAAVLASIAISQMRGYTRRAKVSEVVLAAGQCKTMVSESYPTFDSPPAAGGWGCEAGSGNTKYAGGVQTSANGVIRIAITNLDQNMNGKFVYLVPSHTDGSEMKAETDIGNGVRAWVCGSDLTFVREALPAGCRTDTSVASTEAFGP